MIKQNNTMIVHLFFPFSVCRFPLGDTAISIKVAATSKAEKSNTSAKGCWEPL